MIRKSVLTTSLLLTAISSAGAQTTPDRPRDVDKVDSAQEEKSDQASEDYLTAEDARSPFPDTEAGNRLLKYLELMSTPSPTIDEAQKRFDESLKSIKENADKYADVIIESYWQLDEDRYFQRWSLVKLLADLETSAAYDFLSSVAREDIPQERGKDIHLESTREREMMIRLRAVFGLAALAQLGNRSAEDDLFQLATEGKEGSAIQLRAIKSFLSAAGGNPDERADSLRKVLPTSLHEVITLKPTDRVEFEKRTEGIKRLNEEDTLSDPADANSNSSEIVSEPPKVK